MKHKQTLCENCFYFTASPWVEAIGHCDFKMPPWMYDEVNPDDRVPHTVHVSDYCYLGFEKDKKNET